MSRRYLTTDSEMLPRPEGGRLQAYIAEGHSTDETATDLLKLIWLSDEDGADRMLGAFDTMAGLTAAAERFAEAAQTTPSVAVSWDEAQMLRQHTPGNAQPLPLLTGVFGSAFSGYVLKTERNPCDQPAELLLFYTADYRSELLGCFSESQALAALTDHYDTRRKRCMLC